MNEKRGISLIVLIITIIVIIILAGAVILSLNNTNIIGNANIAVSENERGSVIDAYNLIVMEKTMDNSINNTTLSLTMDEVYSNISKNLGDRFKLDENNNLQEKQEDGSYVTIVTFPNSSSNGGNTPVEPENPNYTRYKSSSAYNKPYIPSDFDYVEGTWDTGLVIMNTEDKNEFVWIPVKKSTDATPEDKYYYYKKRDFAKTQYKINQVSDWFLNSIQKTADANVEKYGGFYIGRYEAGTKNKRTISGDVSQEDLIIKPAVPVYNFVDFNQAKSLSDGLYSDKTDCISTLTTGKQWDTALMFLGKAYADDSTNHGNYRDNDDTNNPGKTGAKENYAIKNVYDMAGNCWEWTNETESSHRVHRGGDYSHNSGSDFPASYRDGDYATVSVSTLSFRVSLYIK